MRILLTNDDGIFAPTLHYLYKQLIEFAEVFVVAPLESRSGASHSISLKPFACEKATVDGLFTGYAVEANPADCVKLAVLELSEKPFDLIVSGLNIGSNAGIDICYSGTVAAAMEGAFYNIPAFAVSARSSEKQNYQEAAKICAKIIRSIFCELEAGDVVNINIPDLSQAQPKGVAVTTQSENLYQEYYIKKKSKDDKQTFQLSCSYFRETDSSTDVFALANGYITVTPLKFARTDHKNIHKFKSMEQKIQWQ